MSQPNPAPVDLEPEITTEIGEYRPITAALHELYGRHAGVVHDCTTTQGMQACRVARAEIRTCRTSLEAKRKEIKAPALERCRLIDADAKRITDALFLIEQPLDAQIKAEEEAAEARREAKRRAEAERVAELRRLIEEIRAWPLGAVEANAEQLRKQIRAYEATSLDYLSEEIRKEGADAKEEALRKLRIMLTAREAREGEEARLAAEREAERERQAAEDKRLREERQRQQEEREQQKASHAAERRRLAKEQAQTERVLAEERASVQREAKEAEERLAADRAEMERELAAERARITADRTREEPSVPFEPYQPPEPSVASESREPSAESDKLLDALQAEFLALAEKGDRSAFDFALDNFDEVNCFGQDTLMRLMVEATPEKEDISVGKWAKRARCAFLSMLSEQAAPAWARAEDERLRKAAKEMVAEWP